MYLFFIILIILVVIVANNIRIVPQSEAYVIERLGVFKEVWQVGVRLKIPFVDKISNKVSLKEKIIQFPPQNVITKDNASLEIDAICYITVTDPKAYTYGVDNPLMAIETLTATTLRNIFGELELDQSLSSRDVINSKLRLILDDATSPWGMKINRVELKDIVPPKLILESMEMQMRAEREKRAAILVAEGEKASAILKAEAEKQSQILHAEAQREVSIREAEGQAQAILTVQEANAKGIKFINDAQPSIGYLQLKSFETFQKVANGQATKIIIPSEIQNLAGFLSLAKEIVTDSNINQNKNPVVKIDSQSVGQKPLAGENEIYM